MLLKKIVKAMILGLILAACVPKQGEKTVEINTDGIFEPVTYEVVGGLDLGEILTGSEPSFITLKVKNNSRFNLTNLNLTLDENSTAGMTFATTDGDGLPKFPGGGGTCTATLKPANECTIMLTFNPSRSGDFRQSFTLFYNNFVDKVSITKTMKVWVGEAASLIFPDEISFYNYGVLEQTEPILRYQTLVIENRGGMTARNLDVNLIAGSNPVLASPGFVVQSHNCPTDLKPLGQCQVIVSYAPLNNNEFDPETDYNGTLTLTYVKDGKVAVGSLNATFLFKATKIQGVFEANVLVHQFTPDIVVGNHETKTLKIINKGYKEGIPLEIIFKDAVDTVMAVCKKPLVAGDNMDCRDPTFTTPVTLEDWPFQVKDVSGCMEVEVPGIRGAIAGESCVFQVTFWPSVAYQVDRNFDGTKMTFKYDSRWKGNVTIINKDMFTLMANSLAAGKLQLEYFKFDSIDQTNLSADPSVGFFDIGRIALITSPAYKTPIAIRVRNIGSSNVDMTSILDGQTPAQAVGSLPGNLLSQSDVPYETFYSGITSNCDILGPNEFCDLSGSILPLFYSNELLQDRLMFDVDPNGVQGPNRYKRFIFNYQDSTTYEDDGTLRVDRQIENRITAVLVTKGFLVWQDTNPSAGDMGIKTSGTTTKHKVILKNVGTGTIPYINIDATKNLVNSNSYYPFKIIADPPGAGVTKDCLPITDFTYDHLDNPFPPLGDLAPGENCAMTVEMKMQNCRRDWDYNDVARPFSGEEMRYFNPPAAGNDRWEFSEVNGTDNITFQYYDGDSGLGPLGGGYDNNYGFYKIMSDYSVHIEFNWVAKLFVQEPLPVESAIIQRASYSMPVIAGCTSAPENTGFSQPALWINQTTGLPPVVNQTASITHVGPLVNPADEYTVHAGTFPVNGTSYPFSFKITNDGASRAVVSAQGFTGGIAQIALVSTVPNVASYPWNFNDGGALTLNFSFTPDGPGIFSTDYHVDFFDGYLTRSLLIHLMGEGIAAGTYADISVTTQDYDVTYVDPITSEVLSATPPAAVPLKFNDYDTGFNDLYQAVKGSAVYAKKQYRLTNTSGTVTINNGSLFIKPAMGGLTAVNAGSGYTLMDAGTCATLTPGASCTFDIIFQAAAVTPVTQVVYVHYNYEIASNQYISKAFRIQLDALDPAKLDVPGQSTLQVADTGGIIYSSYGLYYGNFSDPTHIKQTTYPKMGKIWGVEVRNTSNLKASFLKMVPAPVGDPVLVYDLNDTKIYASRGCFYGDDEFNPGIPANEKGFNATTSAPKKCFVDFEYHSTEKYTGKNIKIDENIVGLEFWNNKRSSSDFIYFHLNGFMEPNYSTPASSYSNVTALSNGVVNFSWGAFTGDDPAWGAITGYRIFQSTTSSTLVNVHTTTAPYLDVPSGTTSVTFTGLTQKKYYYFKVVAKRTKGTVNYLSESLGLGTLKIVVPPGTAVYNHSMGALVDRALTPGFGLKAAALTACAATKYVLNNGGSSVNKTKKLIDTNVWNFIKSDPDSVNFTTYSDYNPPQAPHWLADPATDIAPIFAPYGFDPTVTIYFNPTDIIMYNKPCNTTTCDILDKTAGGDGDEIPFDAIQYIQGTFGNGVFRCWANI